MGKNIEIMAPAGSYECLMAAVQGGAGSVYFGAGDLNMRSKSSNNFSIGDLSRIAEICRQHAIKSYLTLNVVVYDHDLENMRLYLRAAKDSGITAAIVSDMAAAIYASQIGLEVHVSTQANISNTEALRFWAHYADVAVLARELTLEQVKKISENIAEQGITGPAGQPVQIEMFAHGALCMAVSGKCYLSLHEKNSSANRGACQQSCRKAYLVQEKESGYQLEIDNEYIMSPKDLCTIEFLDKVLDAGCTVLKIEGRARSPEYVKTVCRAYRLAADAYLAGSFTPELGQELKKDLDKVFNRGFWDGYYLGQKLGEWSSNYGNRATTRRVYAAKVTNYFAKAGAAELLVEAGEIENGQEFIITGPTTGVVESTATEIRYNLLPVSKAAKGQLVSIAVPEKVRRGDRLYKIVDAKNVAQQ
jgi:U32 family peptidase